MDDGVQVTASMLLTFSNPEVADSSFSCQSCIGVVHDLAPPLHAAYRGL